MAETLKTGLSRRVVRVEFEPNESGEQLLVGGPGEASARVGDQIRLVFRGNSGSFEDAGRRVGMYIANVVPFSNDTKVVEFDRTEEVSQEIGGRTPIGGQEIDVVFRAITAGRAVLNVEILYGEENPVRRISAVSVVVS